MLILLSPAKTLDFSPVDPAIAHSTPDFLDETEELATQLRGLSSKAIKDLMGVSDKIAEENVLRFQQYTAPVRPEATAKQALLAFNGDVYRDWPLSDYGQADFAHAQAHLRILSGFYGILRPLDLIRPYRLEMGTSLETTRGKGLYRFWGSSLTEAVNDILRNQAEPIVVNLASKEYFSAIQPGKLSGPVVTPTFRDWKNGQYKMISFFAKRARGAMADYLLRSRAQSMEDLLGFTGLGYKYSPSHSTASDPVFLRKA